MEISIYGDINIWRCRYIKCNVLKSNVLSNSQSKPANKAILDGPTPNYVHRKFIETLTIESQVFHLECILQTKNYAKF